MEKIRNLISQARLKEAFKLLSEINHNYKNEILGLQSRLNGLLKKELNGIIDNKDANIERNSISYSLISIVSNIEEEAAQNDLDNAPPKLDDSPFDINDKEGFEKVIGRNGLTSITWLQKGAEKSKSVCKIHTSDGYVGTGFLVEGNYIYTNNHVIGSATIAQFSKIEFGYDSPNSESIKYELDHTDFVTSKDLDFSKIKVKDLVPNFPLANWGYLEIQETIPNQNDALVIIQHPQGRTKELAFSDGEISTWEHRLHYKVTTEPGSSGSPVFDINWNVIALHHAGGKMPINATGIKKEVNEGILFKFIAQQIGEIKSSVGKQELVEQKIDSSKPIHTILVYNSADAEYADEISSHLFPQQRTGNIEMFDIINDIDANDDKATKINEMVENASMILILISNNLYKRETRKVALKIEGLVGIKRIIPIKVSPFDLNNTPFQKLRGTPSKSSSIVTAPNQDEVLYDIAMDIKRVIDKTLS